MIHFNKMIVAYREFDLNHLTGLSNSAGLDGIHCKVFLQNKHLQEDVVVKNPEKKIQPVRKAKNLDSLKKRGVKV